MAIDMMTTPAVKEIESSADYGKFEIEPLEPGFGVTLGNSLRRVLLSSLPGAAITSVSIEGIAHEFSSIENVKEDVTEILLNIKEINVLSHSADPVRISLDQHGPREVTAGDIECPSDIEIRNPGQHIATLDSPKAQLRMDLMVERGKGYVTAERNKKEGQAIGVIPIDAIFTPVRKANFFVEKTRVGQETEWDKLVVEVWTDGTLAPVEAVSRAAAAPGARQRSSQPSRRRADRGSRAQRARPQLPQGKRHHQGRPAGGDEAGRAADSAQLRSEVARRDSREARAARAGHAGRAGHAVPADGEVTGTLMRHRIAGRKFGRSAAHRQSMTRNQVTSLLRYGRITTTEAKAKELRRWVERVITDAKPDDLNARRKVALYVNDREVSNKLFTTYLERYKERPGGYTRVVKLPPRKSDASPMAIIELVE